MVISLTLKKNSFEEAANSRYMQSLRKNLINGKKDSRCQRCWDMEDRGLLSKRQYDGDRFLRKTLDRLKQPTNIFAPLSWDIKLGSHCNLKCRMCEPQTSSALMMESIQQNWIDSGVGFSYIKENGNFLKYPHIFEELKNLSTVVEEMYFLGGEPTIIDSHLDLLDIAIASGSSSNTTIRWSTNLSRFDERFIGRAKKFKQIILDCSIDGFHEVNEYIRYPSLWSNIEITLERIKKELPEALIKIVCTVQALNIAQLDKLLEWCEKKNLSLTFNFLHHPPHLSTEIFPLSLRQLLIQKYKNLNSPVWQEIIGWLESQQSNNLLPLFLKETQKFDKARNQDFLAIIPNEFRSHLHFSAPSEQEQQL